MKRQFLKKSMMFPLIESYLEEGESQKSFGQKHNIAPHIMTYWVRKYKESKQEGRSRLPKFVPLEVEEPIKTIGLEIIFPDGPRIKIGERIEWAILEKIITKLSSATTI